MLTMSHGALALSKGDYEPTGLVMLDTGRQSLSSQIWAPSVTSFPGRSGLLVPLWIPLLGTLAVTVWLWRRSAKVAGVGAVRPVATGDEQAPL